MNTLLNEMINWILLYYGDFFILITAIAAYVYLFVTCKDTRGKIIIPVLFLVICLLNPVLYKIVFSKARYWRFFWTLPNVLIISYAVTEIIRRCGNKIIKVIIVISFVFLIVMKGTNVFQNGVFIKAQNEYEISQDTVEVCDIILEDDDDPKCIMPQDLYCETRQYSGNIMQLYGRSAEGGYIIPIDDEEKSIFDEIAKLKPDYEYILAKALDYKCEYIVVTDDKEIPKDIFSQYDCNELAHYSKYIIYKIGK